MLDVIRRLLLRNLGLKIIAALLALGLWVHVYSTTEQESKLQVPLQLVDIPSGMTITGEIPRTVEVQVRGPGREIFRLRTRRLRTQISVADAGEGRFQRPLVADDITLPPDIQARPVEVIRPKLLDVVFDRLETKRVPVFPTVTGAPSSGYLVRGPVEVDPDSLTLQGPQRLLRPYEFVRSLEVGIQGATQPLRASVGLDLPEGITGDPAEVLVVVPIERIVARNIGGLPVEVLKNAAIRRVRIEPETGSVEVHGPESVVTGLRPEDLQLRIDARNLRPGTHMLLVSVVVTGDVEDLVSVEPRDPERFRVTLE
jgi:YbbR domain-containing protein